MDSMFSWLQSFHGSVFFVSFFPLFIITSLTFLALVKFRASCSCGICKAYIESSWKTQFSNICDWYTHLLKNSPTRTIHIHVLNNTVTANPDNVEYMLKTRFNNFPKGKPFSAILGDFLGRGIFNVDGDLWRSQRKMASFELGRISIQAYAFEVTRQEIDTRLIPLLESVCFRNETVDLQDVFGRFSFDFICRFSFGLDPKCLELSLPSSKFAVAFDLASQLSAERAMNASPLVWKIKRVFNIGNEKKLRESIKILDIFAEEVIRQRRSSDFSPKNDLLSRFMNNISDETYLRDLVISFILAGRDTVTSALTSFFWLIANHPEVEAGILAEFDRILGPNQGLTSCGQIRQLHYMHASIYESMRLYPPVQFDSKFCLQDDILPDGSSLSKGTRVTYHPYAMGRMEEIWGKDCLEFKPERWLKNGVFFNKNPFKYPVFQAGARICLGKEMALVEIKSVVVSFLRRFRVEVVQPKESPRFSPGLTATFRDGLRVLVGDQSTSS